MDLTRSGGYLLVALTALAFGFLLAGQLRAQLLIPSNRVARNQALVRSVQELEATNGADRKRIADLRAEISRLESQAALKSGTTLELQNQVEELRAHAGLTPLRGPGVTVNIGNGRPGSTETAPIGYLVNYQDIQDVVNLLYQGGAEGVAVNGRRITPASAFKGSGTAVEIDQGPPLLAPFLIVAVGNRNQMEQLLGEPSSLGDLRARQQRFQIQLSFTGSPDLTLPAYDSGLDVEYARPT